MKKRIRSSIVCVHEGTILVFKGIDPQSGKSYWFLPGGKIEGGEQPWECAERETLEETGYRIAVESSSELIKNYFFFWNGIEHDCQTYFYRGSLKQDFRPPQPVLDADYNKGAAWLPVENARDLFSYSEEILQVVLQLLKPLV